MRKKFMSKTVVAMMALAMTMGSLSGVAAMQPVGVYAEETEDALSVTLSQTKLNATLDDEITDPITATLPTDWSLVSTGTQVEISPALAENTGLTFDSTTGEISGTPAKVSIPTLYTITFHLVDDSDSSSTKDVTAEILISVAGTADITAEVPDLSDTSLKVGEAVELPIAITGNEDDIATAIKFELSGFPAGLSIESVENEDGDVSYLLKGEPSAAAQAGTGYILAFDENNDLLAWSEVSIPAVAGTVQDSKLPEIEISYDSMIATITASDPYIFLEYYKDASKEDKLTNTYVYPNTSGTVVVDLGFAKPTKAFGLRVYGSGNMDEDAKSDFLTVGVMPGKLSIKLDASKDTFLAAITTWKEGTDTSNKPGTTDDLKNYSYRSLYGSEWDTLDNFDFAAAKVAGTTIVVRKDATEATKDSAGAPASAETKVKISASAKAPKVTIDYVKGTISTTVKMQIAQVTNRALKEEDWVTADAKMTLEAIAKKLNTKEGDAITVAVRTAATKTKAASQPTFVSIKASPVLTPNNTSSPSSVDVVGTNASVSVAADADTNGLKVTVTEDTGISFQYQKGTSWKALSSGTNTISGVSDLVVRVTPVKEDSKKNVSGSFASEEIKLTPAKAPEQGDNDDSSTTETPKVTKITITATNGDETVAKEAEVSAGDELVFDADVTADEGADKSVTWTVAFSDEKEEGSPASSWDEETKTLTIAAGDAGKTLVITATSKADSTADSPVKDTFTVTVTVADENA